MLWAGKYNCPYCGRAWNDRDPGVVRIRPPGEPEKMHYWWVPDIGDLRGGSDAIFHPVCFAQYEGVTALIELVHRHDSVGRGRPNLTARVWGRPR